MAREYVMGPTKSGIIGKAIVVRNDKTGKPCVLGTAVCGDNHVNFKFDYDWQTLDIPGFLKDLRDTLARDLDVAVSKMDLRERQLLGLMERRYKQMVAMETYDSSKAIH